MAFPTTGVLDAFTGANGTSPPNANWTEPLFEGDGGLQIQGNQATSDNASFGDSYWNPGTFGPDSEAYITISTLPASGFIIYLMIRGVSPGVAGIDGYYLELVKNPGTDDVSIWRYDDGVSTQLGAAISQEFSTGDALGFEAIGSTIAAYRKPSASAWASLGTRTDSTYSAAGYLALGCQATTVRLDDFGGGTVVVAGGQPLVKRMGGVKHAHSLGQGVW